jgi:hypothetical protein
MLKAYAVVPKAFPLGNKQGNGTVIPFTFYN